MTPAFVLSCVLMYVEVYLVLEHHYYSLLICKSNKKDKTSKEVNTHTSYMQYLNVFRGDLKSEVFMDYSYLCTLVFPSPHKY